MNELSEEQARPTPGWPEEYPEHNEGASVLTSRAVFPTRRMTGKCFGPSPTPTCTSTSGACSLLSAAWHEARPFEILEQVFDVWHPMTPLFHRRVEHRDDLLAVSPQQLCTSPPLSRNGRSSMRILGCYSPQLRSSIAEWASRPSFPPLLT